MFTCIMKNGKILNKKVLLRERKRHTTRRVASAAMLGGVGYPVPGLGGYPIPGLGGVPHPRGVPSPRSGGYPIPGPGGVPHPDLGWGTPPARLGMGYPPDQTWDGIPPRPEMGYPPCKCRQTHRLVSKHYLSSYYVRGQ